MGRDIDIKSGHPSEGYHTLRAFVIPVEATSLTSNLPIGLNIILYGSICDSTYAKGGSSYLSSSEQFNKYAFIWSSKNLNKGGWVP